jgi:cellulose biosynthesis protein BcsQ
MHVVGVYLPKGGVGKTAIAVNLAHAAAAAGERVLLIDLDPQGAAAWLLGCEPGRQGVAGLLAAGASAAGLAEGSVQASAWPRLHVLPMDLDARHLEAELARLDHPRRRLRRLLAAIAPGYDRVVLDCAPSMALLADAVLKAADALLVPLVPSHLSLAAWERLCALCAERAPGLPLWPVFSMVDRRRALHRDLVTGFARAHPDLMPVYLPAAAAVERMGEHRAPVATFAAGSPAARAFAELYRCLEARSPTMPSRARPGSLDGSTATA